MIFGEDYKIITDRLILRIPSVEDIPHVFSATRIDGFNDGMLWEPPEKMEDLVPPFLNSIKQWEKGDEFHFTLEMKASGDFIGRISIRPTKDDGVWNTGYWTHPLHQGKGFMTEAVAAIIEFGFEKLEAKMVEACFATWNEASKKVLERNGMIYIRYIEKGYEKNGNWVPEYLMGISRKEWEKLKSHEN